MNVGVTWVTQALYVKLQSAILVVKMEFVITHGNVFVPVDTLECFVTFAQTLAYLDVLIKQPIRTQHQQVAHFTTRTPTTTQLINTFKIQASIFILIQNKCICIIPSFFLVFFNGCRYTMKIMNFFSSVYEWDRSQKICPLPLTIVGQWVYGLDFLTYYGVV